MSFTIKLAGTPYEFQAEASETILQAGDKAGFLLPSACRSGACGACKAQVLSGTVALGPHEPFALTEADQKLGLTLLCSAKATSDCEIKVRDVKLAQKKPEGVQAEIVEKTLLDPSIMRLVLKRADGALFEFKAGQTYAVELPGNQKRYYSVASSQNQKETVEFLIRKVTNGMFTGMLFSDMIRVGDKMRLKGPEGTSTFQTPKGRKAAFLATGTGIASVKSIVSTLVENNDLEGRELFIYWGVHTSQELVVGEIFEEWAAAHPQIHYTGVVSREDTWPGAKGHVQTFAAADNGDMTDMDAYLCGSNSMIKAAVNYLTARCGLREDHIFMDNFGF